MTAASLPWNDRGVRVTLPLRTISENNAREHWGARSARRKDQRDTVNVTLTRIAPWKLDGDNLQGALKAVRDGVADALGIDDGSEIVEWRYGQERGAMAEIVGCRT